MARRVGEKSPGKGGTWEMLKHTAGFVGCLTNRWMQDLENENSLNKKAVIEKDIQGHLDQISALLIEQESADPSDSANFDLAVKYQLTRIQELLDVGRGRMMSAGISQHMQYEMQEQSLPRVSEVGSSSELLTVRTEQDLDSGLLSKLFSRVRHNRYKEVEAILDSGVSPDVRDQFGNTLIILACQNGNKRIAKICLRRCCDMDAQNLRGQTALHYCYAFGYRELGEYLSSKGARDDITNDHGMTCYDGLEPTEIRLDTTPPLGQAAHRPPIHISNRTENRYCPPSRGENRYFPPHDDDTESLTSTTSGFSTDTTTDTYPSCASPTIPMYDAESPLRRSRSLNMSSQLVRMTVDSALRGQEASHRLRATSISELAEEQARQLEALANALRALKPRDPPAGRADGPGEPPGLSSDERRAWPRRDSCLEVPDDSPRAAAPRRRDSSAPVTPAPPTVEEEEPPPPPPPPLSQEAAAGRWAMPCAPRRLKPTPPPIPPPPTARRVLSMAGGGGGFVAAPDASSPRLPPSPLESFRGAHAPPAPPPPAATAPAAAVGRAGLGARKDSGAWGSGDGEGDEDDAALSARLTQRAAMAGHGI